jgi:regulator of sigma E protease
MWLVYIFAFLIFNLVIVSHEFGHFSVARAFGIKVDEFAIGMGPKIFGFMRNGTMYSIRCLPVGGFCQIEGEKADSEGESSFCTKPAWQRTLVLAAGGFMNIILGFILSFVIACANPIATTTIRFFAERCVSSENGLKIADEIISINGARVLIGKDIFFEIAMNPRESYTFEVLRGGRKKTIENVKFAQSNDGNGIFRPVLDFYVLEAPKTFLNLLNYSALCVASFVKTTCFSLIWLISGKLTIRDMAGPIGIAAQIGEIANNGMKNGYYEAILNIVGYMQMFTIGVGIFNLIPFFALDGGRILFLWIEKLRGKPFKVETEAKLHTVGFYLLICLIVVVALNDIARIIGLKF